MRYGVRPKALREVRGAISRLLVYTIGIAEIPACNVAGGTLPEWRKITSYSPESQAMGQANREAFNVTTSHKLKQHGSSSTYDVCSGLG